jgi:hypothetical protein
MTPPPPTTISMMRAISQWKFGGVVEMPKQFRLGTLSQR